MRQRFISSHLKLKDLEIFCLAVLGNGNILTPDVRFSIGFVFVLFHLTGNSHFWSDSGSLRTLYATLNIKFHTFANWFSLLITANVLKPSGMFLHQVFPSSSTPKFWTLCCDDNYNVRRLLPLNGEILKLESPESLFS